MSPWDFKVDYFLWFCSFPFIRKVASRSQTHLHRVNISFTFDRLVSLQDVWNFFVQLQCGGRRALINKECLFCGLSPLPSAFTQRLTHPYNGAVKRIVIICFHSKPFPKFNSEIFRWLRIIQRTLWKCNPRCSDVASLGRVPSICILRCDAQADAMLGITGAQFGEPIDQPWAIPRREVFILFTSAYS